MDKLWFKTRRAISVLLVFAMLASITPVQAFAEEGQPSAADTTVSTMSADEEAAQKAAEEAAAAEAAQKAAEEAAAAEAAQKAAEEAAAAEAAQKAAEEAAAAEAAQKAAEEAAAAEAAQKAAEEAAAAEAAQKAAEEAAAAEAAQKAAEEAAQKEAEETADAVVEGENATEAPVVEEVPATEEPSVEGTPVEETPVEETPVEETPAEEAPALVGYTVKYLDKATEEGVAEETAGEAAVGETIAIEAPEVEGYTLCADQPTELVLAADAENVATVYYEVAEAAMPAQTLTATAADGATVTIDAPEGALPAGTTVQITIMDTVPEVEGVEFTEAVAYDVTLWNNGVEVQPAVAVSVKMSNVPLAAQTDSLEAYHLADDGSVDKGTVQSDKSADFSLNSFSPIVVFDTQKSAERSGDVAANGAPEVATYGSGHGSQKIELDVDQTKSIGKALWAEVENETIASAYVDFLGNVWVTGLKSGTTKVLIGGLTWQETITVEVKGDTSGQPEPGDGVAAYFYILKPTEDYSENPSAWQYAGEGKVDLPEPNRDLGNHKESVAAITQYPTEYPILVDEQNNTYTYSTSGEAGTYTITWQYAICKAGATFDGSRPEISSDIYTWHVDGFATLVKADEYQATFIVEMPNGESDLKASFMRPKGESVGGQPSVDESVIYEGKTYNFDGWYQTVSYTDTAIKDVTAVVPEEGKNIVFFYGRYVPQKATYTITYDDGADDDSVKGMPDPSSYSVTEGDNYTVSSTVPSRENYEFNGWSDGKGKTYGANGIIENVTSDITLTAQWTPKKFTVTYKWDSAPASDVKLYDANGTAVATPVLPTADPVSYGGSHTVDTTYTNEYTVYTHDDYGNVNGQYTFSGWKLNNEAAPSKITNIQSAVVLTGNWTHQPVDVATYTITYYLEGKQYGSAETKCVNQPITLKAAPTAPEGHTFSGWSVEGYPDGLPATMPEKDLIVRGSFTANKYGYEVHYFYDGEEANELKETGAADFGTEIPYNKKLNEYNDQNYVFVGVDGQETITSDATKNVLNVYYELDVIGTKDPNKPDTVPDKYQLTVTFQANNAEFRLSNGKTTAKYQVVLNKYDAGTGKLSETGTATLTRDELHVSMSPKDNSYNLKSAVWTQDDAPIQNAPTEMVPLALESDTTFVVTLSKFQYKITGSFSDGHGTATPATQTVEYGAEAEAVVLTAELGYYITSVKVNGVEDKDFEMDSLNGHLTIWTYEKGLSSVTRNYSIVVTTAKEEYELIVEHRYYGGPEDSDSSEQTSAEYGSNQYVKSTIFDESKELLHYQDDVNEQAKTVETGLNAGYEFDRYVRIDFTADGAMVDVGNDESGFAGTMPYHHVKLIFYYTPRTDLSYTVNYLDEDTDETVAQSKLVEDRTYGEQYQEEAIDVSGYVLTSDKIGKVTVDSDASKNVINFYYSKDVKGGGDDGEQSDGIPDKYQVKVTFDVVNGTWTEGGNSQKFVWLTLLDENGNWSEDGSATATLPGTAANTGYTNGTWNPADTKVTKNSDHSFVCTYSVRTDLSYTVRYLEDGTARELASPKTVGGQTLGATVTETAIDIGGYTLTSDKNPQSITIGPGENVITFYYKEVGPDVEPTPAPTETPTVIVTPPTTPTTPTTPAGGGATTTTTEEEEVTEEPVEEEVIEEEETPLAEEPAEEETIGEEETPLAGGNAAWALLNLILTILTVLGSILLLIGYLGKKRKEEEDETTGETTTEYEVKKHGFWRVASLIPAIAAVIAFILTEDMRLPMIFVDRWTLLMVIIAVIQIVVAVLSMKEKQEPEEEE